MTIIDKEIGECSMSKRCVSNQIAKRDANWLAKFDLLKAHVAETGHFPDKHCMLNHFCKYTRRKINEGTLEEWKKVMFEELAACRRLDEHTGGRKKKETS